MHADQRFGRHLRIAHARDFRAAFHARLRRSAGPITLFARPNGLDHPRLGLSIGRRVGNAVRRHRLKRHLREAFRLERQDLPVGFDLVVTARPHQPLPLARYRAILSSLAAKAAADHAKRTAKAGRDAQP